MPKKEIDKRIKRLASAEGQPLVKPPAKQQKPVDRIEHRTEIYRYGVLFPIEGGEFKCVVKDLSDNGAKISLINSGETKNFATLKIDGRAKPISVRIIWRRDDALGLAFENK